MKWILFSLMVCSGGGCVSRVIRLASRVMRHYTTCALIIMWNTITRFGMEYQILVNLEPWNEEEYVLCWGWHTCQHFLWLIDYTPWKVLPHVPYKTDTGIISLVLCQLIPDWHVLQYWYFLLFPYTPSWQFYILNTILVYNINHYGNSKNHTNFSISHSR